MATLAISLTTTAGTVTKTLTFSAADALRIQTAFRSTLQNPTATPQDIANWAGDQLRTRLLSMVLRNETTAPAPPDMT